MPSCALHEGSRVVLAGTYGKTVKRQRYRCHPVDGTASHKFTPDTPRMVAPASTCVHCENPVGAHQGPRAPRRWEFPVQQAAEALVMVGQGVSYTETADRMRVRSKRGRLADGAQLVANWVEILGPVVTAEHAVTAWPETVVLDSTWFMVTNTATNRKKQAFGVLAAYGYDQGSTQGRTLAFLATTQRTQANWTELLRSRPGAPAMVVCDEEGGLIAAVVSAWPTTFIKSCEHHLRANAIAELKTFRRNGFGDPLMGLLNGAFVTPAGWAAFRDGAGQTTGASMREWLRSHDAWITEQTKRRSTLPQHHSTGAIEPVIGEVREFMAPRAYCYRNAERTNLMLELVRLRLNRLDDPGRYAQAIREHLDANNGKLPQQGLIRDPLGVYSLRV